MAFERWYPKAHQGRVSGRDAAVRNPRHRFLKEAGINLILLQILFLGLFCYIFGALFQQSIHTHNFQLVYVDYDGGIIGSSLWAAYQKMKGDTFPSIMQATTVDYPSPQDLRKAVCSTRFWSAIYTSPGASLRLELALAGGAAATNYNRSDVITYIWNEARYSPIQDTAISGSLKTLASAARLEYTATNGTGAMKVLSSTNPSAISVFANPWELVDTDIQTTIQGSRLIYNTLVVILILIQEFFYLGTINGLYIQCKIYQRLYPHRIIIYRNMISLAYTCCGSLCTTGAIWAFRAGWNVNGNQFALTWLVLWLFAHSNFLWLDVFTVWLPPKYVPMSLITWVVFNVTSILVPFELSPGFYRWAYAMPAHEVYQALTDIWSRGCNPQLHYALPILFSLELLGLFLGALGVYHRCHYATLAEEQQEKALSERVNIGMAFEEKHKKRGDVSEDQRTGVENMGDLETIMSEREELGEEIQKEDSKIQENQRQTNRMINFGPSFNLAYESV
ncbi:hypothetical protein BP5796_02893 [Coleophoma crateriformis]|uniref:DUF3533 domain-containing protein n=1 Tax=Coleophoma crateriformis TaxID=565419 RepID=A0A3D8T147_9HELO|nr:hypothetical protein BP5796_02893 [Coleophoma crateriformis]